MQPSSGLYGGTKDYGGTMVVRRLPCKGGAEFNVCGDRGLPDRVPPPNLLQMRLVPVVVVAAAAVSAQLMPYPKPRHVTAPTGANSVQVAGQVSIRTRDNATNPSLDEIISRYSRFFANKASANAGPRFGGCPSSARLSSIELAITSMDDTLGPSTDESYSLNVTAGGGTAPPTATISAATTYGARHGLEVLSQLMQSDPNDTDLTVACGHGGWIYSTPVNVQDSPAYSYRGLMIDTSRHYLPVSLIRGVIDALAMHRLNVLHIHFTDSSRHPPALHLPRPFACGVCAAVCAGDFCTSASLCKVTDTRTLLPKSTHWPALLRPGAYAPAAVYTSSDLRRLVQYGQVRGVRVVPEFDMPGHGSWWMALPEYNLSLCSDVFDPTNPAPSSFLADFLGEMADIFPDPLLMLGGDEVGFDPKPGSRVCGYHCFDKDPKVAAWMAQHSLNSSQLLDYFWQQVTAQVSPKINKTI
eukprot:gene3065-3612_t